MDKGRKLLCKWRLAAQQQQAVGYTAEQQLQVASAVAVATLWDLLTEFVEVGLFPATWVLEVPANHPFVQSVADRGPGQFPRLRVRPPVAPVQ
jgi:hypothetical protein